MKYAVMGAAFNPPHNGHMNVIQQALKYFDRVILVPSFKHPFGKKMADYDFRLEMTNALRLSVDESLVVVSDVEREISQQKNVSDPVYTYDVMRTLQEKHKDDSLQFIVGPDNAKAWSSFYKGDLVKKKWGVYECKESIKVRSTNIRKLLSNDNSLTSVKNLVPPLVFEKLVDWNDYWG